MIANPDVLELGEPHSLKEEWNGEAYQNFREQHLSGNIPKACRSCYRSNPVAVDIAPTGVGADDQAAKPN